MSDFKKMIEKKKKESGEMDGAHAAAKGSVLHDLMGQMDGLTGDKVKGLKKVTVASNDKEGLAHGLDKAKELLGEQKDDSSDDESFDDQDHEGPDHVPTEPEAEHGEEDESEEPDQEEGHEEESPDEQSAEDKRASDMERELAQVKAELDALKRSRMY